MEILFLIGRILYGGYFVISGINHLTKSDMLAGYARSKGVPAPKAMVYVSGLFILLGGVGVLLGVYVPYASALIALFLIPVSLKMHAFWAISDPMQKMTEQVNFMKNMALLGAALMLLAVPIPWPYHLF